MQLYTWIFSLAESLSDSQKSQLEQSFASYLAKWNSHGRPLKALILVRHNRFVIVQADPTENRPSGCSIDSLKRAVTQILEDQGLKSVDASRVHYQDAGGEIASLDFRELPKAIQSGQLHENTLVFDHSLGQSDDLSRWEVTLQNSWMKRFLPKTSLS